MGQAIECRALVNGAPETGIALLETDSVLFRGETRVKAPFKEMHSVASVDGRLELDWPGGRLALDLGRYADKWAEKILNPKGLLDKLGVEPGMRAALVGIDDGAFERQLAQRGAAADADPASADLVFIGVDRIADVARLKPIRERSPATPVWIVMPKGRADLKDYEVIAAARQAGYTDVKAARFSATHTALKFLALGERAKIAGGRQGNG